MATSEMRRDVHPFVQDAYNIDSVFGGEEEDEMPARGIHPEPLVDLIVESPKSWLVRERFERLIQSEEILLSPLVPPGFDGVIPDGVEVRPGFRPERNLSHAWTRELSLR